VQVNSCDPQAKTDRTEAACLSAKLLVPGVTNRGEIELRSEELATVLNVGRSLA
jgi:hypothetical protein